MRGTCPWHALFFNLLLTGCKLAAETTSPAAPPTADNNVGVSISLPETAVPTIGTQSTPASQISPPPTIPIVTPTMKVSVTAVPDFDPLGAPDHSAIAPTRDPGAKLDDLIALIQEKLDGRCVSCLHDAMSDEFLLSFYPAGNFTEDKKHALNLMNATFLPLEGTISFSGTAAAGLLPDGVTPQDLYAGPQPLAAVLYSAGWGLAGSGEGLLFIVEENGVYRWAGLTVAADNFAPLPDLVTIAPPPGLVYRLDNGWWQVGPDEHQKLSQHEGPLSLNPSATRALYAESGASSLLLFRFQEGETTTIPVGGTLFHGSEEMPWLDGKRLAFAAVIDGQTRMQLYDINSSERFWLDAPAGTQPVQAAPDYSIYWRHWRQEDGIPASCQQLWIYESGAVKGMPCLVRDARHVKQTTLPAEQLAQLQGWIDTLRTFQVSYRSGQDRLVLTGHGVESPTDAQLGTIVEFARTLTVQLGIYRELPNEATK